MASAAGASVNDKDKDEDFIHRLIWRNDYDALNRLLCDLPEAVSATETDADHRSKRLEKKDIRGRTPLMLAVTLGHYECAKLLLTHKADANVENANYWTVAHEATATGDPGLLKLVLHHRKYQRLTRLGRALRRLLQQLQDSPDFYVEMHWKFSSWIPFIGQMCPSDTYKIYKSGSSVRVDTTLAGFDVAAANGAHASPSSTGQWVRGNLSYRFRLHNGGNTDPSAPPHAEFLVVDHDRQSVTVVESFSPDHVLNTTGDAGTQTDQQRVIFEQCSPSVEEVSTRLTAPSTTTYIDVQNISFERQKAGGLLSWFSGSDQDKTVNINGYNCKVYNACNVNLISKKRTEHLTEEDKRMNEREGAGQTVMGVDLAQIIMGKQNEESYGLGEVNTEHVTICNPSGISEQEYFNEYCVLGERDIGRPRHVTARHNTFQASITLAHTFPLHLHDQILPIVDLMASSNAHFARLKNFIELQLPAGFPVKIDIPLFHVFTAEISFANVHAMDKAVQGVQVSTSESNTEENDTPNVPVCLISEQVFNIPDHYERYDESSLRQIGRQTPNAGVRQSPEETEELMLRMAIEQSLLNNTSDSNTALDNTEGQHTLTDLERAIQASMQPQTENALSNGQSSEGANAEEDADLKRVLELSLLDK